MTTPISLYFIGHIAIDEVVIEGKKNKPTLGGSVSYSSLALKKYSNDARISIISNFNKEFSQNSILQLFYQKNINLEGVQDLNSPNTQFLLDYYNHSRNLVLQSRCPDLRFSQIPEKFLNNPPDAIVLVPLCNEISYDYISKLSNTFPNIAYGIDLQGFIREIDDGGHVSLVRNEKKIENVHQIIKLLGRNLILKGSEEEMKILSGEQEWHAVMTYFQQFEGLFIMTLGEKGSMISKKRESILKIPSFKPKKVEDETGAGDVYLAIFIYEYIKSSKTWKEIEQIGHLASAAASFEIEKKGVKGFANHQKVIERVYKRNYIST
ncbi:MAG: putative sugar kinase [Promethearchaeota archaeon]|nr:MAG: putative sugar kinase [Candidatus Lokiarchaeota archaeon]